MNTMRCLTLHEYGGKLDLQVQPRPVPTGTQVLVKVQRCGICHTDVHLRHGYYELNDGRRWNFADRGLKPPIRMGHEVFGEIISVGPQGRGLGRKGVVFPWIGCGTCKVCISGDEHLCPNSNFLGMRAPGGYGDCVVLPDARYLIDTGTLDPTQAATLSCAGLTAYSALRKVQGAPGWLGVIGAGGIGLTAIALARALGHEQVLAFEPNSQRREAALAAGASMAVDPASPQAVQNAVRTLGGPAGAMIDFVGRPETFTLGTEGVQRGGRYVIVGLFGGEITLALPSLALRAVSISGSAVGSFSEMVELVALARNGRLPDLPVQLRSLEDADAALDELEAGRVTGRIVLQP
jgi:D-arabinose 1-dehydrogenase-like Zn-dependent alcohol dehydrogenase